MKTRLEMLAIVSGITGVPMQDLTLTGSRRYSAAIASPEPMAYNGSDVDIVVKWGRDVSEFEALFTRGAASFLVSDFTSPRLAAILGGNGLVVEQFEASWEYDPTSTASLCAYATIDGYTVNFIVRGARQWAIWRFVTDYFSDNWATIGKLDKDAYKALFRSLRSALTESGTAFPMPSPK